MRSIKKHVRFKIMHHVRHHKHMSTFDTNSLLFLFTEGNSLRDDYKFIHVFNDEVAKFLKASPGQVLMIHPEKLRSKYEPASHSLSIKVSFESATRC